MKSIAIIVTYNRKNLLLECIESLEKQTVRDSLSILVIDNASTDGTECELKPFIDSGRIKYKNTGKNLGGAGGFEYGIIEIMNKNYDYVWLMDDDTIPCETALEKFYSVANENPEFGFLSSYVKWVDGSICKMNIQRKNIFSKLSSFEGMCIPVQYATFVSLFIPMRRVRELGAPIGDFFIWGDDWEYTRRISKRYTSYLVMNSIVVHKTLHNQGCNVVNDVKERIPRYELYYRNNYYISKKDGLKGRIYYILKVIKDMIKVIIKGEGYKKERIKTIINGVREGIKFNPQIKRKK